MSHVLLVADPGGHLALLHWLRPELGGRRITWVTLDQPDVRERVGADAVVFGHGPTARSASALLRNLALAARRLPRLAPDLVLTSGAGLGVPWVWAARGIGIPSAFLEVADRDERPSLSWRLSGATHRLVQRGDRPGAVKLGVVGPPSAASVPRNGPVFVACGTGPHPFERLVSAAEALAAAGHDVVVQHGASRAPRGCRAVRSLTAPAFQDHLRRARAVVLHGGMASRAEAGAAGRVPLVVPRRAHLGEHVDDHQWEACRRDGARVIEPATLVEVLRGWVEPEAVRQDDAAARARFRRWLQDVAPLPQPSASV